MTDATQFDTDMENLLLDITPASGHRLSAYLVWDEQTVTTLLDAERKENDVMGDGVFNDRDVGATVRIGDFTDSVIPAVQDTVTIKTVLTEDGVKYYVDNIWVDGISATLNLRRH